MKAVQNGYKVETLAELTGATNPPPPPTVDVPPYDPAKVKSPAYFQYLNDLLQYAPALPSEAALRASFAKIAVVPGKPFDFTAFAAGVQAAIEAGMAEGLKAIEAKAATATDASGFLGSREFLNDRSGLKRAVGAMLGIYGNSKEEAFYSVYQSDAAGQPLDGANDYTLHFAAGKLPPVNAFWSITMYDGKTKLLIANPLDRYLINSPMLPDLKRDPDGGLTIYLQHASPGKEKESNWLPAPAGPMYLAMRLYWPKQSVPDGKWIVPKIQKAK